MTIKLFILLLNLNYSYKPIVKSNKVVIIFSITTFMSSMVIFVIFLLSFNIYEKKSNSSMALTIQLHKKINKFFIYKHNNEINLVAHKNHQYIINIYFNIMNNNISSIILKIQYNSMDSFELFKNLLMDLTNNKNIMDAMVSSEEIINNVLWKIFRLENKQYKIKNEILKKIKDLL